MLFISFCQSFQKDTQLELYKKDMKQMDLLPVNSWVKSLY